MVDEIESEGEGRRYQIGRGRKMISNQSVDGIGWQGQSRTRGGRDRVSREGLEKACELYELAKKGWEETKCRLRGGHSSVEESILAVGGKGGSPNQRGRVQTDRVNVETNEVENDQDVIEQIVGLDGYDDIEEVVEGEEGQDASGDEIDKRSDEDDSDDVSYLGLSLSCDTEESLYDEFEVWEVGSDNGSDHGDDDMGPEDIDRPPQQLTALDEAERSATRPFLQLE